ncbi:MAG TPA: hypothetical protein VFY97_07675 [Rhodanobacteraceae bacterium]|nr:hypothetical protein [Rhodanobacteraceae bacterium]
MRPASADGCSAEFSIDKNKRRLNLHLDRWQKRLPGWAARLLGWLRRPSSRWLRIPIGLLLVAAGLLGFLPVLGFWMVLPGLLLLALDIPFLRPPMRVVVVHIKRWSRRLRFRLRGRER